MCAFTRSQLLYRVRLEALVQDSDFRDKPSTSTLAISVSPRAACASPTARSVRPSWSINMAQSKDESLPSWDCATIAATPRKSRTAPRSGASSPGRFCADRARRLLLPPEVRDCSLPGVSTRRQRHRRLPVPPHARRGDPMPGRLSSVPPTFPLPPPPVASHQGDHPEPLCPEQLSWWRSIRPPPSCDRRLRPSRTGVGAARSGP